MAKPTERALKRKPRAVILLTTKRGDVPNVPPAGREFEWFLGEDAMRAYFDQNVEFHKADAAEFDDMAYLAVEITDTGASPMKMGRIDAQPVTDATEAWTKSVEEDITRAFTPVKVIDKSDTEQPKKVRPRQKSTAAAAVKRPVDKEDAPAAKAARLKQRLAAKKEETPAKSETGDPAPQAVDRSKVPQALLRRLAAGAKVDIHVS